MVKLFFVWKEWFNFAEAEEEGISGFAQKVKAISIKQLKNKKIIISCHWLCFISVTKALLTLISLNFIIDLMKSSAHFFVIHFKCVCWKAQLNSVILIVEQKSDHLIVINSSLFKFQQKLKIKTFAFKFEAGIHFNCSFLCFSSVFF